MRTTLWPHAIADHPEEVDEYLCDLGERCAGFVAEKPAGDALCGFLEARLRSHADGCSGSPVAYIEGWWVEPEFRSSGVGAALVRAAVLRRVPAVGFEALDKFGETRGSFGNSQSQPQSIERAAARVGLRFASNLGAKDPFLSTGEAKRDSDFSAERECGSNAHEQARGRKVEDDSRITLSSAVELAE